ncbi:MAG: hypothetical protein IPM80_04795 [Proteobacteria bacterium]|nr:hypothetical protein [Pseudomonadota bacterium]
MAPVNSRPRALIVFILGTALLAACALQPQVLPITPRLDVSGAAHRGEGRSIALDAIDGRSDNVVGYRDPNDRGSAITTAPETMRVIKREVENAYQALGFRVVPQGEDADITLEVRLTELGYTRQQGTVVNNIRTGATIEATSVMHGKTVTGTYRDGQGKEMVLKPNLEDNAALMNKHLSAALARMVADPRLTSE